MAANPSTATSVPPLQWSLGGMLFDAWLRLNHNTGLTITQHPVETGAAITDHSYFNPRRFSFDIGVTDTVTSPVFPGNQNRSVNAYNALVQMQRSRQRLNLVTKYNTYNNILIENIDVSDDYQTQTTLRATIQLVEIIVADVRLAAVSAQPQITDQTNRGQQNPQPTDRVYDNLRNYIPFLPERITQ